MLPISVLIKMEVCDPKCLTESQDYKPFSLTFDCCQNGTSRMLEVLFATPDNVCGIVSGSACHHFTIYSPVVIIYIPISLTFKISALCTHLGTS